jgi:hypothetical protein
VFHSELVATGVAKARAVNTSIPTESYPIVHIQPSTTQTAMNIDMTLATSYKPVLLCIFKVCLLNCFHYSTMSLLFATERYALIIAALYIDNWMAYEYIVNTNSCVAVLSLSLLVHELRDAGVQERVHGGLAHTIVLSILVASNLIIMVFGENHDLKGILTSSKNTSYESTPESSNASTYPDKKYRCPQTNLPHSTHFNYGYTPSALFCVLFNCVLLVVLSSCAMPVNAQDPLLNNLRVWSFMVLSLTWLYTVHYRELRYSFVAPFTPCILRFSSILFMTPTPFAIGGIALMVCTLVMVHARLENQYHQDNSTTSTYAVDSVYQPKNIPDRAVVVGRDPLPGSMITYRASNTLQEKSDSVVLNVSNNSGSIQNGSMGIGNGSNSIGGSGGNGVSSGKVNLTVLDTGFGNAHTTPDTSGLDTVSVIGNKLAPLDYDSLFQEVMKEQSNEENYSTQ